MLKVLVISDLYPDNVNPVKGVFVHNQLNQLADCGVNIIVISPVPWSPYILSLVRKSWGKYSKVDKTSDMGRIQVEYPRYLRPPGLWFYPYSGITCYLGIRKTIERIYQRFPFDVLYTNALIPSGYSGCLLARKLDVPSVCYVGESDLSHSNLSKSFSERMGYVILNSTRLVSVSKCEKDRIIEIANPKRPIEVIYRGTDIEVFKCLNINFELKRRLSLPDDSLVITFVGWLIKRKGVSDLLKAFSTIASRFPEAYLMVVGEGPERSNLDALSKNIGVEKRVIFTGLVKNEDMKSYYSITDVMAFPSYAEGLPNAVVEAVACGKPVVATNVGGIPEVIIPGVNGFLTAVGDVEMLSSNIIRILTDTTLRKRMGEESRRIAEVSFDAKKCATKLIDLFKQVIEEHKSSTRYCLS